MSSAITLASSTSWTSPGAGTTGGYDGKSDTLRTFTVFMAGLAIYNACELIIMIFLTFSRFRGMYFWSLLIAATGIIPNALGLMLKFMNVTASGNVKWLSIILVTIGWWPMITGQSLVLWSRLHLIVSGKRGECVIRWTKHMIIINFLILHLPTTVLTFGANGSEHTETFETAYNIMEKIQMAGFFIQELILSSIYIVETVQILRNSLRHGTRRIMKQLIFMNIVIIVLDLGLVGLESASLYILQVLLKSVVYSVKLKLEFAILGKLVQFVRGTKSGYVDHGAGAGFITTSTHMTREEKQMRTSEFVDLSRVGVNVSHPLFTHRHCNLLSPRRGSTRASDGLNMTLEYKIARFEHIDHILKLPLDEDSPRDSLALMHDNQV